MHYTSRKGAVLIVAGTALGAGLLSLPITSAPMGVGTSLFLLIGCWALTNVSASVSLRLNDLLKAQLSIPGLCHVYLGRYGYTVSVVALCGLHIALLSAYIAGVSRVIQAHLPFASLDVLSVVVVCVASVIICFSRRWTDYANRFFFIVKAIALLFLVLLILPYSSTQSLRDIWWGKEHYLSHMWYAAPIFFSSFGFQGNMHSAMIHSGRSNVRQMMYIFLAGSSIPLLVYMLWVSLTLGTGVSVLGGDVVGFIEGLNQASCKLPLFTFCGDAFALCAFMTSFIGVGLGQFDFIKEWIRNNPCAVLLTLMPSLLCNLFYPDSFIIALRYSGMFLGLLAFILPACMAMQRSTLSDKCVLRALVAPVITLLVGFVLFISCWV